VVLVLLALLGCTADPGSADPPSSPEASASAGGPDGPTPADPAHAVPAPGPLTGALRYADLLVYSHDPLSADMVADIGELPGVTGTEQLSLAQVGVENGVITVAAVDPATYRRYTPAGSAQLRAVWTRVAGGEVAVTPAVGRRLADAEGFVRLGNDRDAPRVHVGALAAQVPRVDAVVNERWAEELGLREGNALLIATGLTSPQRVRPAIQRIVGDRASVQILGPDLDTSVAQTAFLTGGSVAASVGSFSYRILDAGRIAPDRAWVLANIRTERVPILGRVTCHRVMLPQLRAALAEVVAAGLRDAIHPDEYAGCYYPRYIAGTTRLSLHSFGIALDLNTRGNQRGTVGEIDRGVVAIFQRWGFTWGGDWAYTDPMHFEMNALVRPA
jgi:hypothetical protein